jgi:hypothetical protein
MSTYFNMQNNFNSYAEVVKLFSQAVSILPVKKSEELLCSILANPTMLHSLISPIYFAIENTSHTLELRDMAELLMSVKTLIYTLANMSYLHFSKEELTDVISRMMCAIIAAPCFCLNPIERIELNEHCRHLINLLKVNLSASHAHFWPRWNCTQ